MTTQVLDVKLQAERGNFFLDVFQTTNYLDVDSLTLANTLNDQMALWEKHEANHRPRWVSEVEDQLNDQTEEELTLFYEKISDERMADVRLILSNLFKNHKLLKVNTLDNGTGFPTINLSVDTCYRAEDDNYYPAAAYQSASSDGWNYDYDCSWKDFMSYAEYNN